MEELLKKIRTDLKKNSSVETAAVAQRFFKEEISCYGVKSADVGRIARKYWKEISSWKKKEIFTACEELYKSDIVEEAFIVTNWVPRLSENFTRNDLCIFKRWISLYINNWAKCDGFCNHTMGDYIEKFEEDIRELKKWAKADNIWLKRASAVSLILPARKGKYLGDVFEICDTLLMDENDMVRKGYGWLLKEASRLHQKDVFDYVVKHKDIMPRTSLRYAVELMPEETRKKAMEKR
jgi:3-methyladenine DNA glycosylase AlkD